MKQQLNLNGVKGGPTQFFDVYEITVDCVTKSGIGIPDVYVYNSLSEIIHNNHGIYNTAAEMTFHSLQIAIPEVQQIVSIVSAPLR